MVATGAVHTVGINWQSIGAIAALLAVAVTVLIFTLNRAETRRQRHDTDTKNVIKDAVDHLSDVLLAKLETKEAVALNNQQTQQALAQLSTRLARIEGATMGQHASTSESGVVS